MSTARPTDEELVTMVRLNPDAEFGVIRQWLERSLAEIDRDMRRATGEEVYRLQGKALCVDSILQTLDGARDAINSRRAQQSGKR